uniref:Uncharacterized protein n=1 Tax=Spongospora subterranea TaxID=70186 RepID=A0A0H5QIX0_9EUKA|eukprot:CRZ01943.1 hypothetical protein [Spongospora subterranea]
MVRLFMDLFDKGPVNGLMVAGMTSMYSSPTTSSLRGLPSRHVVTIPAYTAEEFDTVVGHWRHDNLLFDHPEVDDLQFKQYVSAISCRNPRELSRALQVL